MTKNLYNYFFIDIFLYSNKEKIVVTTNKAQKLKHPFQGVYSIIPIHIYVVNTYFENIFVTKT